MDEDVADCVEVVGVVDVRLLVDTVVGTDTIEVVLDVVVLLEDTWRHCE